MIDDDNTTATELARARAFILQLADRIAICSELLGKRAEKRDATTRGLSMFKCPRCNGENFRVRDTKHVGTLAIKRYRKCRGVFRGPVVADVVRRSQRASRVVLRRSPPR